MFSRALPCILGCSSLVFVSQPYPSTHLKDCSAAAAGSEARGSPLREGGTHGVCGFRTCSPCTVAHLFPAVHVEFCSQWELLSLNSMYTRFKETLLPN